MSKKTKALITKSIIFFILLGVGYAYLYPMIYMGFISFMSNEDLANPTVSWIPTKPHFQNFITAWKVLDVRKSFVDSLKMSLIPAALQTVICAIIGYGFARFEFPLKRLWLFFVIVTFMVPVQVTLVPKYIIFSQLGLVGTPWATYVPSLLGQGIRSSIFILVFYNFFSMLPKAFDEAAELDGANSFQIFYKIIIPMSVPAILVVFIFSFVWYWNETFMSATFNGENIKTMPIMLRDFVNRYTAMFPATEGSAANRINEGIRMAATLITIVPLLITYLILQRWFVEGIERSGITGE